MIQVIAVDDDLLALRKVGKLLTTFESVQTSGFFDQDGYARADEVASLYQGHE